MVTLDCVLNNNVGDMKNGKFVAWLNSFCRVFTTVTDDYGNIFVVSYVMYNGGV